MNSALFSSGAGTNPNACDSITVDLHNSATPFALIESQKGILNINGTSTLTFSSARASNSFYIALKHRNSIETWSSIPVQFFQNTSYDFTNSQTKSYGNNLTPTSDGFWAIYSGDVSGNAGLGSQDQIIESQDYLDMENAVGLIFTGYNNADITGDGVVESADYLIMENNVNAIIFSIHP